MIRKRAGISVIDRAEVSGMEVIKELDGNENGWRRPVVNEAAKSQEQMSPSLECESCGRRLVGEKCIAQP